MDRFARNYLIGLCLVIAAAGVYWFAQRDTRVAELNAIVAGDAELAAYPYRFQVIALRDGIAEMGSPRSAEVPAMQFLRTAFPALSATSVDDPAMMAAQDELAETQSKAAELIKQQPDVKAVRWVLDEQWFNERGVFLPR